MKRPTYFEAINWIAQNDDRHELDVASIAENMTVVFMSAIFGVHVFAVAKDISKYRKSLQQRLSACREAG
jgi:hypothetical protein